MPCVKYNVLYIGGPNVHASWGEPQPRSAGPT